jgi:NADH-quinone oxidoreductase subunit E
MIRVDLRDLKNDFYDKMLEVLKSLKDEEVVIFLFEIGDFSHVQKVANFIYENKFTLMNSLKFNEKDWTVVVKNIRPDIKTLKEEI